LTNGTAIPNSPVDPHGERDICEHDGAAALLAEHERDRMPIVNPGAGRDELETGRQQGPHAGAFPADEHDRSAERRHAREALVELADRVGGAGEGPAVEQGVHRRAGSIAWRPGG
jgi:hypothetical protein